LPVTAAGTRAEPGSGGKVVLEKGHSQVDWMRLTRSGADLSGLCGAQPCSLSRVEIAQHSSEDDCWTVVNDRVYNITSYVPFHPGGKALLLKGAGRDSTALFVKYHPWVNVHYMLERCLVGVLEDGKAALRVSEDASSDEEGAAMQRLE
jgi:cytochrome-b5 reductase